MTEFDNDDVYDVFKKLHERDITHVEVPTGDAVVFYFEIDRADPKINGEYRFEYNFRGGNAWLHKGPSSDRVEVWSNTRRY